MDGTENERCDPGVKKHLPEKGLEIMVNMVIIISARQISNEKMTKKTVLSVPLVVLPPLARAQTSSTKTKVSRRDNWKLARLRRGKRSENHFGSCRTNKNASPGKGGENRA